MSETPFFKTRMGQRYYEHTLPELVRQLERLNQNFERLTSASRFEDAEEERPNFP